MDSLQHAIGGALEPGEQVLWAARPSIRHYVQRRLVLLLLMVGAATIVAVVAGVDLAAAPGQGGDSKVLILGAAAATMLAWLWPLRLRLKTVYAITNQRLIRTGGQSMLTNRPGQAFSYRPQDVRFIEISNFGVWRHVYIDRVRYGENRRSVLVGFEDVAEPRAVRDRIQAWLDAWQQELLADLAEVRQVSNAGLGFRMELPVSWKVEVGAGASDRTPGLPTEWVPALRPWDGRDSGWSRLRATGPAGVALAIEVIDGAVESSDDVRPAFEAALNRFLELNRETEQTVFAGRPATLSDWSAPELAMRVLQVPRGDVEFRIYLIAPAPLPRCMEALQTVAASFQFLDADARLTTMSDNDAAAVCGPEEPTAPQRQW